MSHYIKSSDITDLVVAHFFDIIDSRCERWLQQTDAEIEAVAMDLGILPTMILKPLNTRVFQYGLTYLCMIVCFDNILASDQPLDTDKYKIKWDVYKEEVKNMKEMITRDMLYIEDKAIQEVNRIGGSGLLCRG